MGYLSRFAFVILIFMLFFTITSSQESEIYPPITPQNAENLQLIQMLSNGFARAFSWSTDGQQLSVKADSGMWVYDMTKTDMPSYPITDQLAPSEIIYSPAGDLYITHGCEILWFGCHNPSAYLYDAQTGSQITALNGAEIRFSHDGRFLAISGYPDLRIWETSQLKANSTQGIDELAFCIIDDNQITISGDLEFSPDGSLLVATYGTNAWEKEDYFVSVFDVESCQLRVQLEENSQSSDTHMAFSQNSQYLTIKGRISSELQSVKIWDMLVSPTPIANFEIASTDDYPQWNPIAQQALIYDDDSAFIWDVESSQILQTIEAQEVEFLTDGRLIAGNDNQIWMIDGTTEILFPPTSGKIQWLKISPNDNWMVSYHDDNHFVLWDISQQAIIKQWENVKTAPHVVSFSPDLSWMVWTDHFNGNVWVWDFASQSEILLPNFRTTGYQSSWGLNDTVLVTHGEMFSLFDNSPSPLPSVMDLWMLGEKQFEHVWRVFYNAEANVVVTPDFVMKYDLYGDRYNFYTIQTGELIATLSRDDCDINTVQEDFCKAIQDTIIVQRSLLPTATPSPTVTLRRMENQIVVWDKGQNQSVASYPIPESELNYLGNSNYQFAPNGDVLLLINAKLYNLTQNTLIFEMPPLQAGFYYCGVNHACGCPNNEQECSYPYDYLVRDTWLSDDGTLLFSRLEDNDQYNNESMFPSEALYVGNLETKDVYSINTTHDYFYYTQGYQYLFVSGIDYYGPPQRINHYLYLQNGRTGQSLKQFHTYLANGFGSFSSQYRFIQVNSDSVRIWAIGASE